MSPATSSRAARPEVLRSSTRTLRKRPCKAGAFQRSLDFVERQAQSPGRIVLMDVVRGDLQIRDNRAPGQT